MDRYSILYFLTGTRGGMNRIHILKLIQHSPLNAHQLKEKLNLDYKTIQHHLRLLSKHNFIRMGNETYGATYHFTDLFKQYTSVFRKILANLNKSSEAT